MNKKIKEYKKIAKKAQSVVKEEMKSFEMKMFLCTLVCMYEGVLKINPIYKVY